MNWTTVKHLLQKTWFYIKNYWWVGALISLGFVLHKFFLFDKDVLGGLYKDKVKQNEEELKVINKAHETEIKEKARVEHDHKLILALWKKSVRKQARKSRKKKRKD